MSVHVDINVARGAAKRHMEIHRLSDPRVDTNGHRDPDQVGTYLVTISGNGRTVRSASFKHRYGDDVIILIAKAGDALRAKYDHI